MLSACAIVIARGFELLRLENSSIDHLGRVASGNYRLLPYAIEFWIDHCMRYASVGGNLGPDRPFQYHVTRMCETHKECMHALGHVIQVDTKDEPKVTLVDEQLGLFLNTPIHCLMSDVLRFRRVASQLNDDNRSGRFRFRISTLLDAFHWLTIGLQISRPTLSTTTARSSANLPKCTKVQ